LSFYPVDDAVFDISKEIVKKYKLLPNDALIAATCNQKDNLRPTFWKS